MEIRKCTKCKYEYSSKEVELVEEDILTHECCPKCLNQEYTLIQ